MVLEIVTGELVVHVVSGQVNEKGDQVDDGHQEFATSRDQVVPRVFGETHASNVQPGIAKRYLPLKSAVRKNISAVVSSTRYCTLKY